MRVKRALISLFIIVVLVTLSSYSVVGEGGKDILYKLFLDWLEGKSAGILKVNVLPVDDKGNPMDGTFIIRVHNFTDYDLKPHSDIVYYGTLRTVTLKIYRKPLRYEVPEGEDKPRWIYKPHEYTFFVTSADLKYHGARLLRIEPAKPITEVTVKVRMQRIKGYTSNKAQSGVHSTGLLGGAYSLRTILSEAPELVYETTSTEWMPAIQLHSIQGTTVWVQVKYGNYLFYTQKYRYLDKNYNPTTSWSASGDKITKAVWSFGSIQVSDGTKRWFNTQVKYRYELWGIYYDPNYIWYEEIVTPVEFAGSQTGSSISDSLCGGDPVGSSYSYEKTYEGYQISRPLGPGVTVIEKSGIKVGFSATYGPITVYVELWKEIQTGEASSAPKLVVQVNTWYDNYLTVFDDNTGWKIVHLTWQSTA